MLVLNRNSYNVERYGLVETFELSPTQWAIVEILQAGHKCSYYDITKWVQKRCGGSLLSLEALKMQIYRINKKGIKIKGDKFSNWTLEDEIWLV